MQCCTAKIPSFFPKNVTCYMHLRTTNVYYLTLRLMVLILLKNKKDACPLDGSFQPWIYVISDPIKNMYFIMNNQLFRHSN